MIGVLAELERSLIAKRCGRSPRDAADYYGWPGQLRPIHAESCTSIWV